MKGAIQSFDIQSSDTASFKICDSKLFNFNSFLSTTEDNCLTMARGILQMMQVVDKCIGNGYMFVWQIIPMPLKLH